MAVYREGAETVLFYQALLAGAGPRAAGAVGLGFALGCLALVAIFSERRKEVGLKKAIGAQDRDILQEFFGEAAVLGLAGGSLGGGLGYLI